MNKISNNFSPNLITCFHPTGQWALTSGSKLVSPTQCNETSLHSCLPLLRLCPIVSSEHLILSISWTFVLPTTSSQMILKSSPSTSSRKSRHSTGFAQPSPMTYPVSWQVSFVDMTLPGIIRMALSPARDDVCKEGVCGENSRLDAVDEGKQACICRFGWRGE